MLPSRAMSERAVSEKVFQKVDPAIRFPETEKETIAFWRKEKIFERTLEKAAPNGNFVFYEGPPTANGMPHNGHVLTRVMKDIFPRYKTMRGYHVGRKAGWDTHGLPVEVEVEKELRIHGKAAIENFGVEPFVRRCIDSVFRYTEEWERHTERIAFWVDLKDAYVTYHRAYVESVWWALSQLLSKGLLHRGHKVVWWWAQGGTALSAAEVGQGYKTVDDPSCFVRFPLIDLPAGAPEGLALAAWTTTPWTLPSNMYAAVKSDATYKVFHHADGDFLCAEALIEKLVLAKVKGTVGTYSVKGKALEGLRYRPPFDIYSRHAAERTTSGEAKYFRVLVEDFVTLDTGTGIVHMAPAFGEDDNRAFKRLEQRLGEPLQLFCAVASDGTFTSDLPAYKGRWVKEADKDLMADLKSRGLLLHAETYRHEYPYCWRSDEDPLIQYARPAWFIRTTDRKAEAIDNNRAVHWMPAHIKEGRFGDFLQNNVDWALSRERFWGTPLNVWVCEKDSSHLHAPASVDEILKLNHQAFDHFHAAQKLDPTLNPHLLVHKPWIDQVTFPCPHCGATARRVTEVIDAWFDSGCMPFAQWGFPHAAGSEDQLRAAWPADYICEAIDQTRGWFYSLLMISTLVFDASTRAKFQLERASSAHPYKTCIVLGHVGDRDGKKESKSKGNYAPPDVILDRVRMQFAVLDEASAGVTVPAGECAIARDDLDSLDLQDGATLLLYRGDVAGRPQRSLVVRGHKKLPRRVVILHPTDAAALTVTVYPKGLDIKPFEVPRLPVEERVYLEDPTTPSPGADAFRWFFYASGPPWTNTRLSLSNVRAYQKDFAIKLRNVFSFFTIYADIDSFDPRKHQRRATRELPSTLDRFILSELALSTREIVQHMDSYEAYESAQTLIALVESLSNWYVRRSRERFWAAGDANTVADKRDAYGTLYEVLVTIAKLSAPFVPYLAEEIYRGLVADVFKQQAPVSVHLCDFPTSDESAIDAKLSREMGNVRATVSLGLKVRGVAKLKVRQPLATAFVFALSSQRAGIESNEAVIRGELNVHALKMIAPEEADKFVVFDVKPDFAKLGKRAGKQMPALKKWVIENSARVHQSLRGPEQSAKTPLLDVEGQPIVLAAEDVQVVVRARDGFAAGEDGGRVVVLDTRITPELKAEGAAREVQNRLQAMRKDLGLGYADRVEIALRGPTDLIAAITPHRDHIASEVLCTRLDLTVDESVGGAAVTIADATVAKDQRTVEIEGVMLHIAMRATTHVTAAADAASMKK
ncbi:MAG: hypothetical protein NVSMB1_04960 [Polyangiales bacterium]